MKKRMSILLSAALLFSLTACGEGRAQTSAAPTPSAPAAESQIPAPAETAPAPEESGKVLVAYFSATGRTGAVAQTIADTLGADLFEITPAQPYTPDDLDWRDENSRVSREHSDPTLQTVELTVDTPDHWEDYGTVFIGYPIWWQNVSWVVTSFVSANDFAGKTVIPFCTSSSSGLGESDKNLAAATKVGDWREGVRFRSSVAAADVTEWVNGLGLPAGGEEATDGNHLQEPS